MTNLPERIRTFIAVPVPDSVRARIADFQQRLKREWHDVAWTRPEAMHLTLRFLGNIESAGVTPLTSAVQAAIEDVTAFELSLGEAGTFGERVIWIGIDRGAEPLRALAEKVRNAADAFSAHEEERRFNPHVTIGRCRRPIRGVGAALRKFALPPFDPWTAESVEIIRSELSPAGSIYTPLATMLLRQTPAA